MNGFTQTDCLSLHDNLFKLIGKDWMLVTAGDQKSYNTMTASWGGAGVLWNKNVAFTFIRPQRYTLPFMEANDYYTLSFYPEAMRSALSYCGTKSGRDVDKAKETGLIPVSTKKRHTLHRPVWCLCAKSYMRRTLPPTALSTKRLTATIKKKITIKCLLAKL